MVSESAALRTNHGVPPSAAYVDQSMRLLFDWDQSADESENAGGGQDTTSARTDLSTGAPQTGSSGGGDGIPYEHAYSATLFHLPRSYYDAQRLRVLNTLSSSASALLYAASAGGKRSSGGDSTLKPSESVSWGDIYNPRGFPAPFGSLLSVLVLRLCRCQQDGKLNLRYS